MCVWMRWAVTRAPKKACHEMSEKGPFWGQLKVKAPHCFFALAIPDWYETSTS
jgi:hypothetical protein